MVCDKISYKTHSEDHNHIKGLNKRKGGSYKTYKCKECDLFHVTTIKKSNKNTRADKRNNNSVNQKSINPIPKRSIIIKSVQTTYKPFEHFKNNK